MIFISPSDMSYYTYMQNILLAGEKQSEYINAPTGRTRSYVFIQIAKAFTALCTLASLKSLLILYQSKA